MVTTTDTVLIGVTCSELAAGVRVVAAFMPQAGTAVATEIRRQQ